MGQSFADDQREEQSEEGDEGKLKKNDNKRIQRGSEI